jgi:hypothetical protein
VRLCNLDTVDDRGVLDIGHVRRRRS